MEIKDYAITEILTISLTVFFAPIASKFSEPYSLDWYSFQLMSFLSFNFIILIIYSTFFEPPKEDPEVPNVLDAFDKDIRESKYNLYSTSTKDIALWKSPTFLYYLNLNTIKSISEAARGPSNVLFSTDTLDKKEYHEDCLNLLSDYARNERTKILSKYTGLRFLIYPKRIYEKNKDEIKSLISIHALGRIHCIPVIREELLNKLNKPEKDDFKELSGKLNQKIRDEYTDLSRIERLKLKINKKNPYSDTIPDFLIIDSCSTATKSTVWWYEKNDPKCNPDVPLVNLAQKCLKTISQKIIEDQRLLLWKEFTQDMYKTVPVIKIDNESDFFSKEYYQLWLNEIIPNYPRLINWIEKEKEFLEQTIKNTPVNRALDVGCGWGRHMEILLDNGVDFCAGVDISPSMIKKSNELYRKYGNSRLLIKFEDVQTLSFDDDYFDLITCMTNTFGNLTVKERVTAINEIYRVLRPNGIFLLSVYNDTKSAKREREDSYIEVGLRPYPVDEDPSIIRTQEGLYSKEFTYAEIAKYLNKFNDFSKEGIDDLALIFKAQK